MQQRREFNCPQRANSCFPSPLRTEALYTRILVCLKDRFNACVSNTFGKIIEVHIAPERTPYEKLLPAVELPKQSGEDGCRLSSVQLGHKSTFLEVAEK